MSEILSSSELRDLTGYKDRNRQRDKLTELGIPWRANGSLTLVSREHARLWLRGESFAMPADVNWNAVK